jgi:hypothetical protein
MTTKTGSEAPKETPHSREGLQGDKNETTESNNTAHAENAKVQLLKDNVPTYLKELKSWVEWKKAPNPDKPGKFRKIPHYVNGVPRNGEQGSAKDRANLATFDEALIALEFGFPEYDGIGFAMMPEYELVGVDFDDCIDDNGVIAPHVLALIEGTYAEISPSGRGIRAFYKGNVPDAKNHDAGIELFCEKHYLTTTGNPVPGNVQSEIAPLPTATRERLLELVGLGKGVPGGETKLPVPAAPLAAAIPGDSLARIKSALAATPSDDRKTWTDVGMALKQELGEEGFSLWDEWSKSSEKYDAKDSRDTWESFDQMFGGIGIGTLFRIASKEHGWHDPGKRATVTKPSRKFAFTQASVIAGQFHKPDWLIPGMVERDTLITLTAKPKAYKSFMALDWACCIATATPWNGRPVKQGAVFLIVGEGLSGIGRRLAAWSKHHGISLEPAPLFISNKAVALTEIKSALDVSEAIEVLREKHGEPALIVVDTLARNFGPEDENSTSAMNRFVQAVDSIRGGAAALIVHHMGHEGTRSRGSSALIGAIDFGHKMEKLANGNVRLETSEVKDHKEPEPMYFKPEIIELDELGDDGRPVTSVVLLPVASDGNVFAPPLKSALTQALRALAQAAHDQGVKHGAHVDHWQQAFYASSNAEKTNSKYQAFKRAKEGLLNDGIVTCFDDFYSSSHKEFTEHMASLVPGGCLFSQA